MNPLYLIIPIVIFSLRNKRSTFGIGSPRHYFGGNSGYKGYSKSLRAIAAENSGLRNKSQMDADFLAEVNELIQHAVPGAPTVTLKQIKNALNDIPSDEWHHTSMYGNKTKYYSAKTIAEYFTPETTEEKEYREKLEDLRNRYFRLKQEISDIVYNSIPSEKATYYTQEYSFDVDVYKTSDGTYVEKTHDILDNGKLKYTSSIRIIPSGKSYLVSEYDLNWEDDKVNAEYQRAVEEYNAATQEAYDKVPQSLIDELNEIIIDLENRNFV